VAQAGMGNPALANNPYVTTHTNPNSESGSSTYSANTGNPRLNADGSIKSPGGGEDLVQVGGVADDNILDPSKVTYDPEFGAVAPRSAVRVSPDRVGPVAFGLTAAALGGAAFGGMGAAGEGLGAAGDESAGLSMANPFASQGTGAFDVGGSTGFGGSTPLGNYAPVTDLSTTAQQPGIGSRMLTNLQQGRGLLGMRTPVNSGIAALVNMLRQPQNGGGK
jgi:hypothetical protein